MTTLCWNFVRVRAECSHICFLMCRHDSICLALRHSSLSSKPIHLLYRDALCMCWARSQNRNRWERDDASLFSEFIPLRFCCRCFLAYFFHRFLCIRTQHMHTHTTWIVCFLRSRFVVDFWSCMCQMCLWFSSEWTRVKPSIAFLLFSSVLLSELFSFQFGDHFIWFRFRFFLIRHSFRPNKVVLAADNCDRFNSCLTFKSLQWHLFVVNDCVQLTQRNRWTILMCVET